MLLVDDDDAKSRERREHSRSRAHDNVYVAAPDAMPLVMALAIGQPAVLNRDALAERGSKESRNGRRKRNLGNHEQRLAPSASRAFRQPEIDLGLATAGHAMQERHAKVAGVGQRAELLECPGLFGRQRANGRRDLGHGTAFERIPLAGFLSQYDQAARREAANHV
jgi:hypothetical protein